MSETNRKFYSQFFTKNMSEKNVYEYITNNISFDSDLYIGDCHFSNFSMMTNSIRKAIVDKIYLIEENLIEKIKFTYGPHLKYNTNNERIHYAFIDVYYDSDDKFRVKQYLVKIIYIKYNLPYVINITSSLHFDFLWSFMVWQHECDLNEQLYLFELNFTEPVIPEKKYYTLREDMDDYDNCF